MANLAAATDHSVSHALSVAHATLHNDGETNDMERMFTMLANLDSTVRTGFMNVETRLNNVQATLKTITDDVNHLKSTVNIVEDDLTKVKTDVIPNLENKLTARIEQLEQARLESELYSKKQNLLFFNIPPTPSLPGSTEDVVLTLRRHLPDIGVPNAHDIMFINAHRLPTKSPVQGRHLPIITKFANMFDRNMVLNFRPAAKKKFSVSPHLPAVMQQERRRLIPIRN